MLIFPFTATLLYATTFLLKLATDLDTTLRSTALKYLDDHARYPAYNPAIFVDKIAYIPAIQSNSVLIMAKPDDVWPFIFPLSLVQNHVEVLN